MPSIPAPGDDLTALLEEIGQRWSKVAYVGLKPEVVPEPGHQPSWLPDVPRLLGALGAVLKAHRPNTADGRCNWCRDPDGQRSAFPCGEYLTIKRILTGEDSHA